MKNDECGEAAEDPERRHRRLRAGRAHGRAPAVLRQDVIDDHAVLVSLDRREHRLDQRLRQQVRLQAQVEQLRVGRRGSSAPPSRRAGSRSDRPSTFETDLAPGLLDHARRAAATENCSVNWLNTRNSPASAGLGHGELDAPQRVDDVQVPARLAALAVHRERVPDHGLHAEAVERRAEHVVVVEPRRRAARRARSPRSRCRRPRPGSGRSLGVRGCGTRNGCCASRAPSTGGRSCPAAWGTAACPTAPCARS